MQTTIDTAPPQVQEAEQQALLFPEQVRGIVVVDQASYSQMEEALIQVARFRKWWVGLMKPIKQAAKAAHDVAYQQDRKVQDVLDLADSIGRPRVNAFLAERRRKERAEQERIEREAREAEAQRQTEFREQEERQRLEKAEALEKEGRHDEASEVIEAPMPEPPPAPIAPPPPAPTVQKSKAVWEQRGWKWRVTNEALLRDKRPELFVRDDKAIGALVRSLGNRANLPGVEVWEETDVRIRG